MPAGQDETTDASSPPHARATEIQEIIAVVLLSVTAILTAWSGFESSKWGGAMSISFSQASSARVQASEYASEAAIRQSTQVALFTQWVQAYGSGNKTVADFVEARFPEPLQTAFADWLATKPLKNPSAPRSPFDMPSYKLPENAAAAAASARADAKFQQALRNNQRGDNYTVLTVLFAAVLFFAAVTSRVRMYVGRWILLGMALALFFTGIGLLSDLPKLV